MTSDVQLRNMAKMLQLLGGIAVASLPSAGYAGDLGAVSRGSVAISVTIAPRVEVARYESTQLGSLSAMCVRASGMRDYSVTISALGVPGDKAVLVGPLTSEQAGCANRISDIAPISGILEATSKSAGGQPLMLLIAPE